MSFWLAEAAREVSISVDHHTMQAPSDTPGLWVDEQKVAFHFPLHGDGEQSFSGLVRGSRTLMGRPLKFESSGVEILEEFGTAEIGVGWSRIDSSLNRVGVVGTIGATGTRILSNEKTPLVGANFVVERKREDGSSWIYFLNYANNRTRWNNIPIPGFAYSTGGPAFRLIAGLPFVFVMWRPDPWAVSTVLSPFFASLEGSYRFWGPLQLYSALAWSPRSYQNIVQGSDDRLLFDKSELGAGLRLFFGRKASFTAGFTHNFGRRLIVGQSLSDENRESIALDNSGGFHLRCKIAF